MTLGFGDLTEAAVGQDQRPVLIVTGLAQEARIAAGPGKTVICSSSDPSQLRALLKVFDPKSICGVISFGVAGGLDPNLRTGDVVIASEVIAGEKRWQAAHDFSRSLLGGLDERRVNRGSLVGVEQVIAAPAGKKALRSATGASACDMESHIAANYAEKTGLPFAAICVISDPANRALPAIATNAIKPDGNIDLVKVMRGLARNPMTLSALVATGRDFNRALRSLRGCRGFLIIDPPGTIGLAGAEV